MKYSNLHHKFHCVLQSITSHYFKSKNKKIQKEESINSDDGYQKKCMHIRGVKLFSNINARLRVGETLKFEVLTSAGTLAHDVLIAYLSTWNVTNEFEESRGMDRDEFGGKGPFVAWAFFLRVWKAFFWHKVSWRLRSILAFVSWYIWSKAQDTIEVNVTGVQTLGPPSSTANAWFRSIISHTMLGWAVDGIGEVGPLKGTSDLRRLTDIFYEMRGFLMTLQLDNERWNI